MAKVKHIKRPGRTFFLRRTRTQCGKTMDPNEVVPRHAPMCRVCCRNAGWWTPMKR